MAEEKRSTRKMLSRFANIFKVEKAKESPVNFIQRPSLRQRKTSPIADMRRTKSMENDSVAFVVEDEIGEKNGGLEYQVNEAFEMEEGVFGTDVGNSDNSCDSDSSSAEKASHKVSKESDFSGDSGFDNCLEREVEVMSITMEEDDTIVYLYLEDKAITDPGPWLMESVTDEAPRDPGSSDIHHEYSERDYEGHRAHSVYVGVHIPTGGGGSHGSRRHRRRHHRHRHPEGTETNEHRPITPPAQRVQFLLGGEGEDGAETHPLFSEMEELYVGDGDMEWRETARWIKFEEDVEEGGNRWSKPHVATLSLHSLFELRSFILHGSVLLEMDATNLEQISDLLIDNWVNSNHLTVDLKDKVKDAMLRRHKHLYEKQKESSSANINKLPLIRSLAEIGRNYSSSRSNANFNDGIQNSPSAGSISGLGDGQNGASEHKSNLGFMKKIPPGAEASNILVGEVDFLDRPVTAFVRLKEATMLGDLTEVPVPTRFLFVLLGPTGGISRYHEIGRAIATLMSDEVFHDVAYKGKNRDHLLAGVDEFLDAVTVLPPGEWDPSIRIEPPSNIPSQDQRKHPKEEKEEVNEEEEEQRVREEMGLKRSGKLFGGLINDVKRKAPWYWSDIKDAFALQSVASYIFLYFACLTPIITFGGLLGEATHNRMAAIESLVSGFICGILYGFFSGQPLTILGSTGPVLVFETILFDFCHRNELDYLSFRLWIGIWVGLILFILVATDASYLVSFITRFTEENFATLIAFIFIYKAVEKLLKIGSKHAINPPDGWPFVFEGCMCNSTNYTVSPETYNWSNISKEDCSKFNGTLWGLGCDENYHDYEPNVFLMSVALFCGTFIISVIFKDFKFSLFFPTKVRQVVSDFSVIIAIISMTGIDYAVGVHTPKLEVPEELAPTWEKRGWLVPMFGHEGQNPWWTILAAPIPALLATILIFMDQQITAVIVNRKENKLKKGCGYHLDLFILSILIVVCSVMGLPWFVAATVLSINHVNSLKLETECAAPGEKPQFLGVRENRVTHVLIFITIGLSVLLTPLLKCIPMPVLFGVFLYMGVSSLKGLQFFDRILIIFMPVKWQPDYMFLRLVQLRRVHLFTAIQLACLIVLWVIKSFKSTSILFPIMLVFMIAVRKALDKVFTMKELKALDDIMPDFHRKSKYEEKQKEMEEFDEKPKPGGLKTNLSGNFQIPLANGNVIKIPADAINISEEMNKSGVWKHLESEQTSPTHVQSNGTAASKRHTGKEAMNEDETKRLSILEEDEEDHGITITVDPKKGKDDETPV